MELNGKADPRTSVEAATSRIYEIGEELTDLLNCHLSDSQIDYFWSLWTYLDAGSLSAAFGLAHRSMAIEHILGYAGPEECPFCHDPKCNDDCGLDPA